MNVVKYIVSSTEPLLSVQLRFSLIDRPPPTLSLTAIILILKRSFDPYEEI